MRAHEIMSRSVVTVTPGTPIVQAAKIMLRNHIGGLPVVDSEGKLIGIVTDGDFIRRAEIGTDRKRGRWLGLLVGRGRLNTDFVRSHGRSVSEIMTPNPATVGENATLAEIVGMMERKHVKRLPVVVGDRLVGIVSYRDFVQALTDLASRAPGPTPSDDILRQRILTALDQAACSTRRVNVMVRDGTASLHGAVHDDRERQAALVAARTVDGVKDVRDYMWLYPPAEQDLGGGDLVSLQEEPSTDDDQPL